MIKVGITGAAGRMGRMLVQAIHESDGLVLGGALERPGHDSLGRDPGELAGVAATGVSITDDVAACVAAVDTLVDFSVPDSTLAALEHCVNGNTSIVIGTTGFDEDGLAQIRAASERIAGLHGAQHEPRGEPGVQAAADRCGGAGR